MQAKLALQDAEMNDMRFELDLLKRRLERQESEYVSTLKMNTALKHQIVQLQENKSAKQKDEIEAHQSVKNRETIELKLAKRTLEKQLAEVNSQLDDTIAAMRN